MSSAYFKLVEPYWESISIYDGAEKFTTAFNAAPEKVRVLFAIHWFQSEVMNGGLGQFFSNPTGILAPEAVAGLRAIGMPECASILDEAMKFFGDVYPRKASVREDAFEAFYTAHGSDAVPLLEQEDAIATTIEEENGGIWEAADRYAARA